MNKKCIFGLGCSMEEYAKVFEQLKCKPSVPICMGCGSTMRFHEDLLQMKCSLHCSKFRMLKFISLGFAQELDEYDASFAFRAVRDDEIRPTKSSTTYSKIQTNFIKNYFGVEAFDPLARLVTTFRRSKHEVVVADGNIEAVRSIFCKRLMRDRIKTEEYTAERKRHLEQASARCSCCRPCFAGGWRRRRHLSSRRIGETIASNHTVRSLQAEYGT